MMAKPSGGRTCARTTPTVRRRTICVARQIGRNRADSLDVRGISLLAVALHPGCDESCSVEWDSPASPGTLRFERVGLHRGREVPSCPRTRSLRMPEIARRPAKKDPTATTDSIPADLAPSTIDQIVSRARDSALARHSWSGRGRAPIGYINGLA